MSYIVLDIYLKHKKNKSYRWTFNPDYIAQGEALNVAFPAPPPPPPPSYGERYGNGYFFG